MRKVFRISVNDTVPSRDAVLAAQGIRLEKAHLSAHAKTLLEDALNRYRDLAQPRGVVAMIAGSAFSDVYTGAEWNEAETPLVTIYPKAQHLALFAVTLGSALCDEISRLFAAEEFALGTMLDAAASEGTELTAQCLEAQWGHEFPGLGIGADGITGLRFSPGYCWWHISGQRKLFDYLRPEEIGITLRDSFLMEPLKSISGVIVAGPVEIFDFSQEFPCCSDCRDHSCRARLQALRAKT